MHQRKVADSNFSFFVDSYKASNIAKAKPAIDYHFKEICEHLSEIIKVCMVNDTGGLVNYFKKSLDSALFANYDVIDKAIEFGENLKLAIVSYNKADDEIDQSVSLHIRKVIYHYLELADELSDYKVNSLAIQIGNLY